MKKNVLLGLIAITAMACSSKKSPGNSLAAPSITVLSPKNGEVFHAGQYVTVKWKSSNLPKGTLIELQLANYTGGKKIVIGELVPQTIARSLHTNYYTVDDGEEVVQIPSDTSFYGRSLYHRSDLNASYGKTFKFSVSAITPTTLAFFTTGHIPATVEGPVVASSEDFFTVTPH